MTINKIDISDAESRIARAGYSDQISIVTGVKVPGIESTMYVLDGGGKHHFTSGAELLAIVRESIESYDAID